MEGAQPETCGVISSSSTGISAQLLSFVQPLTVASWTRAVFHEVRLNIGQLVFIETDGRLPRVNPPKHIHHRPVTGGVSITFPYLGFLLSAPLRSDPLRRFTWMTRTTRASFFQFSETFVNNVFLPGPLTPSLQP